MIFDTKKRLPPPLNGERYKRGPDISKGGILVNGTALRLPLCWSDHVLSVPLPIPDDLNFSPHHLVVHRKLSPKKSNNHFNHWTINIFSYFLQNESKQLHSHSITWLQIYSHQVAGQTTCKSLIVAKNMITTISNEKKWKLVHTVMEVSALLKFGSLGHFSSLAVSRINSIRLQELWELIDSKLI